MGVVDTFGQYGHFGLGLGVTLMAHLHATGFHLQCTYNMAKNSNCLSFRRFVGFHYSVNIRGTQRNVVWSFTCNYRQPDWYPSLLYALPQREELKNMLHRTFHSCWIKVRWEYLKDKQFYTNFNSATFEKIPISHLTHPMKQKFLH